MPMIVSALEMRSLWAGRRRVAGTHPRSGCLAGPLDGVRALCTCTSCPPPASAAASCPRSPAASWPPPARKGTSVESGATRQGCRSPRDRRTRTCRTSAMLLATNRASTESSTDAMADRGWAIITRQGSRSSQSCDRVLAFLPDLCKKRARERSPVNLRPRFEPRTNRGSCTEALAPPITADRSSQRPSGSPAPPTPNSRPL
jgi:hypothetical protein